MRTLVTILLLAASSAASLAGDTKPQAAPAKSDGAWSVKVQATNGARYTGIVMRTPKLRAVLDDKDRIEGKDLPAGTSVQIKYFNGLNGSITLKSTEIARLEIAGQVADQELVEQKKTIIVAREQRWQSENERLKQVDADRAMRAASKKAADDAAKAAAEEKLSPELQQWIDKYPPSEGWVPAKKAELYYQTVVVNNRPPTAQESAWFDDYDQWKVAYDAWLGLEQKRIAAEEKAKQEGTAPVGPPPEPSTTSKSKAAQIDPANPAPADAKVLPPPVDPAAPKPDKIDPATPKPAPLEKDAPKPIQVPGSIGPTGN